MCNHWLLFSDILKTHESDSEVTLRRLVTITQKYFFAQSGVSIRGAVWKWSGETRFPGPLATSLENFRCYDFCPVYFVSPRLTAPGSPRMELTMENMF